MDALHGVLVLPIQCPCARCYLRFHFVSSWSLAPGAESSCQAFPAYFYLKEHPASAFPGHKASGAAWAGHSLGRQTVRCSESPACPLTQGTVGWDGSRGTHQLGPVPAWGAGGEAPKLFGQASSGMSQVPNCSVLSSLQCFSNRQRDAGA